MIPATISNGNSSGGMFIAARRNSRIGFPIRAVTGDQSSRNVSDVKFPSDYTELLMQVIGGRTQFLKVSSFMGRAACLICDTLPVLRACLD